MVLQNFFSLESDILASKTVGVGNEKKNNCRVLGTEQSKAEQRGASKIIRTGECLLDTRHAVLPPVAKGLLNHPAKYGPVLFDNFVAGDSQSHPLLDLDVEIGTAEVLVGGPETLGVEDGFGGIVDVIHHLLKLGPASSRCFVRTGRRGNLTGVILISLSIVVIHDCHATLEAAGVFPAAEAVPDRMEPSSGEVSVISLARSDFEQWLAAAAGGDKSRGWTDASDLGEGRDILFIAVLAGEGRPLVGRTKIGDLDARRHLPVLLAVLSVVGVPHGTLRATIKTDSIAGAADQLRCMSEEYGEGQVNGGTTIISKCKRSGDWDTMIN